VPDRCIAARDMIVSMKALNLATESAAHYQPHDHLNPLATGFAQVFDMLDVTSVIIVLFQQVEEHVVPTAIKEPRPLTLR